MKSFFQFCLALGLVSVLIFTIHNMPGGAKSRLPTPDVPPSDPGFAFLDTTAKGHPVTWRTCDPIEVVVETTGMPDGAVADVQESIRLIVEASDVNLSYSGTVTGEFEAVREDRGDSLSRKRSPIMIGWTDLDADMGTPDTVAFASPLLVSFGKGGEITSSVITVHTGRLKNLKPGFPKGNGQGQIYIHELAHSLGLDHVSAPTQLMYERTNRNNGHLAAGDIAGLNALAASMC